jgi:hypothetical protein
MSMADWTNLFFSRDWIQRRWKVGVIVDENVWSGDAKV